MESNSLEYVSGIPISLNEDGQLVFGSNLIVDETGVRRLDELVDVVMEPDLCRGDYAVAYWMYNGVYLSADQSELTNIPLRYELTYIPTRKIGQEYIKTHGHRHFPESKSGLQYAEICEVLLGTAHFLFQLPNETLGGVSTVFYIEAKPGEKVLFPPGWDHCTINPTDTPLLFSDVVALGLQGDYSYFKQHQGAAYWEVCDVDGSAFIPNPGYGEVPPLIKRPVHHYPQLHLTEEKPLYRAFLESHGQDWEFLLNPSLFWLTFPDLVNVFTLE